MEYNLLKTIEPNLGLMIPSQTSATMPRLSSVPSIDCVNPGLGQISRLYSFYVPLHSKQSLHLVEKNEPQVEPSNQEGGGNIEMDESSQEIDNTEISEDTEKVTPEQFNEMRKKRLGSPIHASFLHPKMIKTDKIIFKLPNSVKSEKKPVSKNPVLKTNNESKPIKHKFQFY